jgi:long-subunit acyl-CoA synthetase (AMP-forming)
MMIAITADPAAASPFEGCPPLGQVMATAPLADAEATKPDDTAIIIYTSGRPAIQKVQSFRTPTS